MLRPTSVRFPAICRFYAGLFGVAFCLVVIGCSAQIDYEPAVEATPEPSVESVAPTAAATSTPVPESGPPVDINPAIVSAAAPSPLGEGASAFPPASSFVGSAVAYGRPLAFSSDGSAILVSGVGASGFLGCEGVPQNSIWRIPLDGSGPTEEVTDVYSGGVVSFVVADGWAVWTEACDGYFPDYREAPIDEGGRIGPVRRVRARNGTEVLSLTANSETTIEVQTGAGLTTIESGDVVDFEEGAGAPDADLLPAATIEGPFGSLHQAAGGLVMLVPPPERSSIQPDLVNRNVGRPDFRPLIALPGYAGLLGSSDSGDECAALVFQPFFTPEAVVLRGLEGVASIVASSTGELVLAQTCGSGRATQYYLSSWEGLATGDAVPIGVALTEPLYNVAVDSVNDSGVVLTRPVWDGVAADGASTDRFWMSLEGSATMLEAGRPVSGGEMPVYGTDAGLELSVGVGWTAQASPDGAELWVNHNESAAQVRAFATNDPELWLERDPEFLAAELGADFANAAASAVEPAYLYWTIGGDAPTVVGRRIDYEMIDGSALTELVHPLEDRVIVVRAAVPSDGGPEVAAEARAIVESLRVVANLAALE